VVTVAEQDNVTEPEPPVMVVKFKMQLRPEDAENDRFTVPANPFKGETVIVVGQEALLMQPTVTGVEGEMVKSWTV
jgi:hypothetical protein